MTSCSDSATSEVCTKVKNLGYAASKRIRIYGEEFEIVSDPFLHNGAIAIHVRTKQEPRIRILLLPAMLLQAVTVEKQHFIRAA